MIRKKKLNKGNFHKIATPIVDTESGSPKYFRLVTIPDKLTLGRNVIKFLGNTKTLRVGTPIQVEVLDSIGEPVYSEFLPYADSDGARYLVIYVTDETSNGKATITFLGTANTPQGSTITNLKYIHEIQIANFERNDSELLILNHPSVEIHEKVISYQDPRFLSVNQYESASLQSGSYLYNNGGYSVLTLTSTNDFRRYHQGGTIFVQSATNTYPTATGVGSDVSYTASIRKVINDNTILIVPEYKVTLQDGRNIHSYKSAIFPQFTVRYIPTASYTPTQNRYSYAYITVANLEPSAGNVSRIKVFSKSTGTPVSDYRMIGDVDITGTDLLIDTGSSQLSKRIGHIESADHINQYFQVKVVGGATTASLSYNRASLVDSVVIDYTSSLSSSQYYILTTKPAYASRFVSDVLYSVSFDTYGQSVPQNSRKLKLDVYASGSAFNPSDFTRPWLGKFIGSFETDSTSIRGVDLSSEFTADKDGDGHLQFVESGGNWFLSNITLKSQYDVGYCPNTFNLVVPIPPTHINDLLDFKLEFYNYKSDQSAYSTEVTRQFFRGGNVYISGEENILTGSLFVAGASGSGVQISGTSGSFIRSVGYSGFVSASSGLGRSGFLLFSGSVLSTSGDNYTGVGLELFASTSSYLRYRSSPALLEVVADSFFIGATGSQFVSASGNRLVISSSNFWLMENGDLIIGENATILGSLSANSIATPASGPPYLSQITSDGYARFVSASIGGFDVNSTNISSSNGTLILSSSGQITGSSVLFTGGKIGGFVVTDNTISSLTGGLILSASGQITGSTFLFGNKPTAYMQYNGSVLYVKTDDFFLGNTATQYISGSGNNIEISSSNFWLKPTGEITASRGLLGADSAGWKITGSRLESFDGTNTGQYFIDGGKPIGSASILSTPAFKLTSSGSITGSNVSVMSASRQMVNTDSGYINGHGISSTLHTANTQSLMSGSTMGGNSYIIVDDFLFTKTKNMHGITCRFSMITNNCTASFYYEIDAINDGTCDPVAGEAFINVKRSPSGSIWGDGNPTNLTAYCCADGNISTMFATGSSATSSLDRGDGTGGWLEDGVYRVRAYLRMDEFGNGGGGVSPTNYAAVRSRVYSAMPSIPWEYQSGSVRPWGTCTRTKVESKNAWST